MEDKQINKLVKELEPYFFGYTAKENKLKNDNGLEFLFYCSWNGKTTVSGLGGKDCHSIGCSFTKPLEKIAKDIKRRLLSAYRDDFFEYKKEQNQLKEKEAFDRKKLAALAQVSGGKIRTQYANHWGKDKYVNFKQGSISQGYDGKYKIKVEADFGEALKIVSVLREIMNQTGNKKNP